MAVRNPFVFVTFDLLLTPKVHAEASGILGIDSIASLDPDGVALPEQWVAALNDGNMPAHLGQDLKKLIACLRALPSGQATMSRVTKAAPVIRCLAERFGMKLDRKYTKFLDKAAGKRKTQTTSARFVPVLPNVLGARS